MPDGVIVKAYGLPPVDEREALRYAGCRGEADEKTRALLKECIMQTEFSVGGRVCYRVLSVDEAFGLFPSAKTSRAWTKRLAGCEKAVVFAATIGIAMDRLFERYANVSVTKAALFQALGAERVEALCDEFCGALQAEFFPQGLYTRPRFSPGYGDFPLTEQKTVFAVLDPPRKIGVSLNDSLLMSPTKSVTAIVGLTKTPCAGKADCKDCAKTDCAYRNE